MIKIKTVLDQFPGYVYWKNTQLKFEGCNAAFRELFDLSDQELIGRTNSELNLDERVRGMLEGDYAITPKSPHIIETFETVMPNDNQVSYFNIERKAIKDGEDKIIGIITNITHIRELERVKEEKASLEDIIYHLPGLIYIKNTKSEYIGFNENVVKLSGLSRDELYGKNDYELNWGRKEADQFVKDDREVMETGVSKATHHIIPIKKRDGNDLVVRTDKSVLKSRSGEVMGILGVAIDITEQSQDKNKIQHDFEYILSKIPGYVYWKNSNSMYMGCNDNLAKFSKLKSPADIYGKTDYDFQWGAAQADQFVKDDQYIMKTGKTLVAEYELPQQREDGRNLFVRTEKMPFYDANGQVVGVLGVAVDITEEKELERNLISEKKRAEGANELKTQFMRNMEHDIRTPFTGILGMSSYLRGIEEDPKKKSYLGDIVECAEELLGYCNSILDYSKIESGILMVSEKKFSLQTLLQKVIRIETPSARNKRITLLSDIDKNLPAVIMSDEYRLYRVLINLVSNAIKFTENKGKVKICVSLVKRNENHVILRFSIIDTGIGIPEEQQDQIFEKFSRLSPSNKGFYKGMGVGLKIVKQFVNELEGEIDLISSPEKGTTFICTFSFRIPLTDDFVS